VSFLSFAFVVPRVGPADFASDAAAMQSYLRQTFAPRISALRYYARDLICSGLDTPTTNWWGYTALIRKGTSSDHEVSRIDNGGYGVILLDFDLERFNASRMADFYTTWAVSDAILRRYQEIARLTMPRPKPRGLLTAGCTSGCPDLESESQHNIINNTGGHY